MGIFDSVCVPCPSCGHEEWFQSKGSDDAYCRNFNLAECPVDVLSDVNRHSPHQCEKCEQYFAVDEATRKPIPAKPFDWSDAGIGSWYSRDPVER